MTSPKLQPQETLQPFPSEIYLLLASGLTLVKSHCTLVYTWPNPKKFVLKEFAASGVERSLVQADPLPFSPVLIILLPLQLEAILLSISLPIHCIVCSSFTIKNSSIQTFMKPSLGLWLTRQVSL